MRKSWRELRRHKEGRVLPRIVPQTPKAMSWTKQKGKSRWKL
jgi:hypothetical protein